jgi:Tfp pilus assembly protein PilN
MSRAGTNDALVIGGEPRVNLLPPEVRRERAATTLRRRLGIGVVGLLAVMIVGTGGATVMAIQAQAQLRDEQSRTTALLAEQTRYIEVRKVQNEVSLVQAAQQVGVSTEIDWKKYLESVQATLPGSVGIDTVAVDSASPLSIYAQATTPLQGARVATVGFTARSSVLPDVPAWLNALATLPGFADALPGSVTLQDGGVYQVSITMHINDAAFAKRFSPKEK